MTNQELRYFMAIECEATINSPSSMKPTRKFMNKSMKKKTSITQESEALAAVCILATTDIEILEI
jgi:hypothetical protein